MDLVHKQDIPLVEIGQQRRQIPRLFNGRAGGDADIDPHLLRDDPRQRGLAQTRRPVEQHMIQRFLPLPGRLNKNAQILLGLFLTDVLRQSLGPQRGFLSVLRQEGLGHDGLLVNIVSKINAHSVTSYAVKFIFWMHAAGSASARPLFHHLFQALADNLLQRQGFHVHALEGHLHLLRGVAQHRQRLQQPPWPCW